MTDLERLQGTWRMAALELNGALLPSATVAGARVVVSGTRFTSLGMGAIYEGDMTLDEGASPKLLSILFVAGPEVGNTNNGAYELEGDQWRLCLNMSGGPAPKVFATTPGDGMALENLVREA